MLEDSWAESGSKWSESYDRADLRQLGLCRVPKTLAEDRCAITDLLSVPKFRRTDLSRQPFALRTGGWRARIAVCISSCWNITHARSTRILQMFLLQPPQQASFVDAKVNDEELLFCGHHSKAAALAGNQLFSCLLIPNGRKCISEDCTLLALSQLWPGFVIQIKWISSARVDVCPDVRSDRLIFKPRTSA